MREILFRGKRVDNGEWIEGFFRYSYYENSYYIDYEYNESYESSTVWIFDKVIPETVGQYTGMIDRNGNKIFEGDKVAFVDFLNGWETECIGEVLFSEYGWHFTNSITESNMHSYEPDDIEIIGNIHDEEE